MSALRVSVSNLELFRVWRDDEDLSLDWLLSRLRGQEQTEAMKAGEAFHDALERIPEGEVGTLASGEYRFDFNCDCDLYLGRVRELPIQKQYGDLLVRGRVDAVVGKTVHDHKTTSQFDPDRLWSGYQWRLYLDMTDCDEFVWNVFVMREFGPEHCYEVYQAHQLHQRRYPNLHEDCLRLVSDYQEFSTSVHLDGDLTAVLERSVEQATVRQ